MARKDALANMRAILVKRRDALRSALAGDLTMLRDLHDQSPGDVIDAAYDTAQDEVNSQLAEVESRELASIENALERMKEGTYGQCEVCGGKIPMARLDALPYATVCIGCQRELERSGEARGRRSEEPIGGAFAQQRFVAPGWRQLGARGAAFQFQVIQVGGALHMARRARQRRQAARRIEVERAARAAFRPALVEQAIQMVELGSDEGPVVERGAQGGRDGVGQVGGLQVARHHGHLAVAGAVVEGGEFHGGGPRGSGPPFYGGDQYLTTTPRPRLRWK